MASEKFSVIWREDSSATVLGRLAARNGSGKQTGRVGEGRWLKQSDISSITCKVFDMSVDPDVVIATPAVVVKNVIYDRPILSQSIWDIDTIGYNFLHDLAPSNFPTGTNTIRVEYRVTTSDGAVFFGIYEGPVKKVQSS